MVDDGVDVDHCVGETYRRLFPLSVGRRVPQCCMAVTNSR